MVQNLNLHPGKKECRGAIEKAREIVATNPKAWMPMQFENEANIDIHRSTTAQEIIRDFPEGLDYLITGVGTGGHITGVAYELKKKYPQLKVFAVEPELSPVISGGKPGPHPIQGIGAGFIPKNLHTSMLDGVIPFPKRKPMPGPVVWQKKKAFLWAFLQEHPWQPWQKRLMNFLPDPGY